MNSIEFIREVKNSKYNYEGFDDEYCLFQKYQKLVRDTLMEFHRVCEKNHVRYQLAYGSLLGAIRDGGQIPWDYDADVFVPYCEKEKLIKALNSDLSDQYYYRSPETDSTCRHFFIRLAPKGYRTEILHVDVFYVIGAPDEAPLKFGEQLRGLIRLRFLKLVDVKIEAYDNLKVQRSWMRRKILYSIVPLKRIERDFDKLCMKYDFESSQNEIVTDFFADRQLFHSDMWDTMLYNTSDGEFRVPKNYKDILVEFYDYPKLLPINERIDEFRNSLRRLKHFDEMQK